MTLITTSMPAAVANAITLEIGWLPGNQTTVAGYQVHVGGDTDPYLETFDVGLPSLVAGSHRTSLELAEGTQHAIRISAYDAYGMMSPTSEVLTVDTTGSPEDLLIARALDRAYRHLDEIRHEFSDGKGMPDLDPDIESFEFVSFVLDRGTRVLSCDFEGNGSEGATFYNIYADDPERIDLAPPTTLLPVTTAIHEGRLMPVVYFQQAGWDHTGDQNRDMRPACGDLDGDGRAELVVGFGSGNQNTFQLFDDLTNSFRALEMQPDDLGFHQVAPETLGRGADGGVHPAVGDLDGDGAGELIFALDGVVPATLAILDDHASDFARFASGSLQNGLLTVQAPALPVDFSGRVIPLTADLDSDAASEIIVVFVEGDGVWLEIFDDAGAGFAPLASSAP